MVDFDKRKPFSAELFRQRHQFPLALYCLPSFGVFPLLLELRCRCSSLLCNLLSFVDVLLSGGYHLGIELDITLRLNLTSRYRSALFCSDSDTSFPLVLHYFSPLGIFTLSAPTALPTFFIVVQHHSLRCRVFFFKGISCASNST